MTDLPSTLRLALLANGMVALLVDKKAVTFSRHAKVRASNWPAKSYITIDDSGHFTLHGEVTAEPIVGYLREDVVANVKPFATARVIYTKQKADLVADGCYPGHLTEIVVGTTPLIVPTEEKAGITSRPQRGHQYYDEPKSRSRHGSEFARKADARNAAP